MFEISVMSDLQYHFACGTLSLRVKEIDLCSVFYTRKVSNQVPISSKSTKYSLSKTIRVSLI